VSKFVAVIWFGKMSFFIIVYAIRILSCGLLAQMKNESNVMCDGIVVGSKTKVCNYEHCKCVYNNIGKSVM